MPTARVERRLAAVMATDIVAYSRMIGTDAAGTLAANYLAFVELASIRLWLRVYEFTP